jgi:hypothetical protein
MKKIIVLAAGLICVGQLCAAGASGSAKPSFMPKFDEAAALVAGIDSDAKFQDQYAHIFEGKLLGAHRGYQAILRGIISNYIENYRTALSILLNGNGFDRGIDPFTVVDEETRPVAVLAAFLAGASPFYSPSLVADLTAGVNPLNKAHVEKVKGYVDLGRKFYDQKRDSSHSGPIAIMRSPLFKDLLKDLSPAGADYKVQASDGLKRAVRGINSLESNTSKSFTRIHSDLGQSSDVTDLPIVPRSHSGPMRIPGSREAHASTKRSGSPSSDGSGGGMSPSSGAGASAGSPDSPSTAFPSLPTSPPLTPSGRAASDTQALAGVATSRTYANAVTTPGTESTISRGGSVAQRSLIGDFNAVSSTGRARTTPRAEKYSHKSAVVSGLYYDLRGLGNPNHKFRENERVLNLYLSGAPLEYLSADDHKIIQRIFNLNKDLASELRSLIKSESKSLDESVILKFKQP